MRLMLLLGFAQFLLACGIDTAASSGNGGDGGGGGSGGGSSAALPCDVQDVLTSRCQSCHGNPPTNGAPMSLVTYEDLVAKNTAGVTVVQRCIDRMNGVGAQMPPAPAIAAPAADIATLQAWVGAGMPPGTCTPQPDPFSVPPRCTSGVTWSGGDGSSRMEPGVACIHCHQSSFEAPRFTIAGTVYPTGHEPNECFGAPGGATIEVTTSNGSVVNIPVNGAGNFYTQTSIAFPIHVAVVVGGKRRSMAGVPASGDCNSCHTQTGANMAPGRIVLP